MDYGFTTSKLKELIAKDLKIDVAFPFFSSGKNKGTAACCVVDTEWIDTICNAYSGSTADDNDNRNSNDSNRKRKVINVKTPSYVRHIPTDPSQQKQAPTNNIYVNVLPKLALSSSKSLPLYHQPIVLKDRRNQVSPYHQQWPLTSYIHGLLEGKTEDEKLKTLTDAFSGFESILNDTSSTTIDGNLVFIQRVRTMLWPKSRHYRVVKSKDEEDQCSILTLQDVDDDYDNCSAENVSPSLRTTSIPTQPLPADTSNSNLPDVFAIVESDTAYYFLATYRGTTLQDLITYNPGILDSNLKKGFIIYQLLRIVASLHSRGILHGNILPSNIFVDENLWIQISGIQYGSKTLNNDVSMDEDIQHFPLYQELTEEPIVMQWVRGDISNFSYLMILNTLAGRREGDPNFHPILPWVTDFTGTSIESGWRDFTKTKFRINKGDEQLDFTFDGPVPHHITDILSDITYYVYLARKTPIPVLCQFVRSKYEPNEYPSSMQRLYQWTPDECIPEFYTDPTIFKSLHEDMADLQIPSWSTSPEDFIHRHAEALESDHVSSMLHHWIDLTFGNRLTGKEAIESKNVALPLLAGQNSFMKHGIIQLFQDDHPQRGCNWNNARSLFEQNVLKKSTENASGSTIPPRILETSSSDRSTQANPLFSVNNKYLGIENQQPQLSLQPSPQQHQQLSSQPSHQQEPSSQSLHQHQQPQPQQQQQSQQQQQEQQQQLAPTPTSPLSATTTTNHNRYGISESPSSLTLSSRGRASSVHSTTSSVDTSLSVTSKTISFDNTGIGGLGLNGLNVTSNNISSALRNESIKLPMEIPDEYFLENLIHYEDTMKFSATNKAALDEIDTIPRNPALPEDDPITKKRYNIDPDHDLPPATNVFSVETAHDMLCVGQVMEKILMAGNQNRVTLDNDGDSNTGASTGGASACVYLETDNGEISYDITSTERANLPPEVTGVISALKSDIWYDRPTAKSILFASFPAMSMRDPRLSFPLADHIPDMYEYLAAFYQAEWSRRLYLADKWIDRICELEDEAFLLILPTFIQLFTHHETRVGSIGLFSKLAHRLGRENTRKYLLKPVIAMFETLRPAIPKILFETKVVKEFIKRLGIAFFLQQMLPCYLEALAMNGGISKTASESSITPIPDDMSSPASPSITMTPTTGGTTSVPELASDSLVQICKLLGPVLTSKHIVRQLVKLLFRDDSIKPILLNSVVVIAGTLFGETFTSVQYTYLISLITAPTNGKVINERDARVNYVVLMLLGKLLPFMSNQAIITELKSGLMETLYRLLEPILSLTPSPTLSSSPSPTTPGLEQDLSSSIPILQLTISMRSIEYLLQLTAALPLSDWESTVIPILRKYFSGFISTVPTDDPSTGNEMSKLDPRKNCQMMYAYSRLCEIVGKNTMYRLIPTSTAIEAMMYDSFSLEPKPPTSTVTETALESVQERDNSQLNTPSLSDQQSSPTEFEGITTQTIISKDSNNKLMSWIKLSSRKETQTQQQDTPQKKTTGKTIVEDGTRLLDSTKLYDYATKDLYNFIPLLTTMPLHQIQSGNNAYIEHQKPKNVPLVLSSSTSSITDSSSASINSKKSSSSALLAVSGQQKLAEKER
ncbi:hypothetical protein BCR42DRAFT_182418 [Absidia repens]|uniref:BEACH domain-containing protein n=1 Tax=Absidia repens TaxID=90262 RepID=A0A1X2HXX4_9FUNG|nr:hypothetical protein BCR42DRAFT_182418 [Absidia repens]